MNFVISDSDTQCFFGFHDYHQFLSPCHSGIQKIALEEHVVRNMDGHHHDRIFASLGLVPPDGFESTARLQAPT